MAKKPFDFKIKIGNQSFDLSKKSSVGKINKAIIKNLTKIANRSTKKP